MLRGSSSLTTCAHHVACRIKPQHSRRLFRQFNAGIEPLTGLHPAGGTGLKPSFRAVRLRTNRLVIKNGGGPAGGINRSKNSKGKEVSTSWSISLLSYSTHVQSVFASCLPSTILYVISISGNNLPVLQVDTPGKKLLVGVAIGYLALVLVVPTLNVFVQVCAV